MRLAVAIAAAGLAIAGHATAAESPHTTQGVEKEDLSEVIVTARFREEKSQDVGQTITAFSGKFLESVGAEDFTDYARRTPGLNFIARGPNRNEPSIRGIARLIFLSDTLYTPPLVGQYVDDVSVNSSGNNQRDMHLFDVSRVEVLRGPQGSLFGEGALGGAIRTMTNNPDLNSFGMRMRVMYGSTAHSSSDDKRIDAMVNIPIIEDKLGIRFVGYGREDGGFIDNTVTGARGDNTLQSKGGRVVILAKPTERFTARFSAHHAYDDIGADWAVFSSNGQRFEDFTISRPGPDQRNDDAKIYSLKLDYDAGPLTVSSITGQYKRHFDRDAFDTLQTFGTIRGFLSPVLVTAAGDTRLTAANVTGRTDLSDDNFSQEVRVISNLKGSLNFVAGLFYRDAELRSHVGATSPQLLPIAGTDTEFTSNAILSGKQRSLFGELTWKLSPKLSLIGGARYYNDKLTIAGPPGSNSINFALLFARAAAIAAGQLPPSSIYDAFGLFATSPASDRAAEIHALLPKLGFEYRPREHLLLYGNVAKGARNGGFNSLTAASAEVALDANGLVDQAATNALRLDAQLYDEDSVLEYELGSKLTLLNGRLLLNTALYYNDWHDIQTQFTAPSGAAYIENAGDAVTKGIEVEAFASLNNYVTLFGGGNWMKTAFSEDTFVRDVALVNGVPVRANPPLVIRKGDKIPNAPEYTFNVGVQVEAPIREKLRFVGLLDYQAVGPSVDHPITRLTLPRQRELPTYGLANLRLGLEEEKWSLTLFAQNLFDKVVVLSTFQLVPANQSELYILRPRHVGIAFDYRY